MNFSESLYEWIKKISSPELGPACPYALKAWMDNQVGLAEDGSNIPDQIPLPEGISVCVVPRIGIEYGDLSMICYYYNKIFSEYIFLDTHPEETLRLRGEKTVWEYPAIIIQRKEELLSARSHLKKIGFYKNWDRNLLSDLGIEPDK